MGRSRGGLTTKIHALVDANGLPIALKLTEGQAHDGRSAEDMLGDAARAYDSDGLRHALDQRGAWANIKLMPNRKKRPAFSAWLYRQRNAVERFFNKIKQFRGIATRCDKDPANFLAAVVHAIRSPRAKLSITWSLALSGLISFANLPVATPQNRQRVESSNNGDRNRLPGSFAFMLPVLFVNDLKL